MKNQKIYGLGDAGAYHLQVVSWKREQKVGKKGLKNPGKPATRGRSYIEHKLAEILDLINPHFKMNRHIGPYEVDFLFDREKLVIEANGKAFHDPRKDAVKENYLLSRGYLVVYVTGSEIVNDSWGVYKRIRKMFRQLGFRTYA
jgi:very-short-patch-repair endonuclease